MRFKKIFFFLSFYCAIPASIFANEILGNSFVIKGKIAGVTKGTLIIAYQNRGSKNISDTILIKSSSFYYKGYISEPTSVTIIYNGVSFNFYAEPAQIKLISKKDSFQYATVYGSKTNNEKNIRDKMLESRLAFSKSKGFTADEREIMFDSDTAFIRQYPKSYFSLFLLNFYFSDLDYFFVQNMIQPMHDNYRRSKLYREIEIKLSLAEKTLPGTFVKDFSFENLDGNQSSFRSVAQGNKIILVDFWASWCIPCKKNYPFLKEIFVRYRDSGFAILSISVDNKRSNWKNAVERDSLNLWSNGIDDQNENLQNLFGIGYIPAMILMKDSGEIIGRYSGRWKGNEAIKEELATLFKK